MKLIIILLIILSCNPLTIESNEIDYSFDNNIEINSIEEAMEYTCNLIEYKNDIEVHGIKDYWQLPEETYYLGTGDCEDSVIFFMWLLYEKLNIFSFIVLLKNNISNQGHVVCLLENKYYNLTPCFVFTNLNYLNSSDNFIISDIEIIPYNKMMDMTYYYHRYKK